MDNGNRAFHDGLAAIIGIPETLILLRIDFWAKYNEKREQNFHDGYYWTYGSTKFWAEQFTCISEATVKRAIKNIERLGLVAVGRYNKKNYDKTKWYRVNYGAVIKLCPSIKAIWGDRLAQNDPMDRVKMTQPIPDISLPNNQKKTQNIKAQSDRLCGDDSFSDGKENVFQKAYRLYGEPMANYALYVVDWYIDDGYFASTHLGHPDESKAKRMAFALKLLECAANLNMLGEDFQYITNAMERCLEERESNIKPTIYYITTPRILGYWLLKDSEISYDMLRGTIYEPAEN